jgi:DNA repair exonuclease SbcCD ATPase subunit
VDDPFANPDNLREAGSRLDIPGPARLEPPTHEQLRTKYLKLQDDLSRHLSAVQLKQRADELEKEVAAAKEKEQRLAREKSAADELEKAKAMLTKIASQYQGTAAAAKAHEAMRLINGEGVLAIPPVIGFPPPATGSKN